MCVRPGRGRCDGAGLRPAPCHKSAAGLTRQCKTLEDIQELCAFAVTTHLIFPPETLGEQIQTVAIRNVVMMGCSGMHFGPWRDHNRPRERGPKHMDPQTAHMSFHLFALCMRFERVRTKASLCCRGASQPSSALGPLTMCSDARLRAEAPIEFTRRGPVRPGIVAIGRIPNVSALPLKYTRCTFTSDVKKGGECLGVHREGNDWPED